MSNRTLRIVIVFSLLTNLLIAIAGVYFISRNGGLPYLQRKLMEMTASSHVRDSDSYYRNRVSLFNKLPNHTDDIYFVGDSITDFVEWHELLNTPHAKNRGINSDTTERILFRLNEIVQGEPAKVFLMCGINNIQGGVSADQTIMEYRNILEAITSKTPLTKVYIQSVLPINERKYRQYTVPRHPGINIPRNDQITGLNDALKTISRQYTNVQYVDLSRLVDGDGQLNTNYTFDGVHLNGEGLLVWAEVINRYIHDLKD